MALLTDNQITEIADTLEALRDELRTRRWSGTRITEVLATASGTITGHALMRAPVPQQAYLAPPPYPYGPDDFSLNAGGVALQVTVTGRTRAELEDRARQHGEGFFGEGADLMVTLNPVASPNQPARAGELPSYTCGAIVRERETR